MNKQITIGEVLSAITKHRGKAVVSFVVLMAIVVAAYVFLPRNYSSEGKLFVQLGRTGTGLDPSVSQSTVSIQDSRETEIRSVVELVKSRAVIEAVVEKIGPDLILAGGLSGLTPKISLPTMPWNRVAGDEELAQQEYERLKQLGKAARKIESSLAVYSEKKTSVISIYCKANSPSLAQKIVEQLMSETQLKHLEVHSVKGSTAFFDDNFEKKQQTVVQAENRLKEFRNQNKILSIEGAVSVQQNVISKLKLALIDAEVDHAEADSKLAHIQSQMDSIKPIISVPKSGMEKLSTEDSRTELFKLESELAQLEKRYSNLHPKIRPLKESVEQLRVDLNTMPTDRTESESQSNPVYEQIKVGLVNAAADAKSRMAMRENLQKMLADAMGQLESLNSKEAKARQLRRDMEIANQEMDIYVRKRTESAVVDQLDQSRISDVVVAQRANFVVKPVSPKGTLLFPLGALVSMICAIATALYFEKDLLSGHLSEEEVEQILELPILVSLPTVPSQRNMVG